MRPCPWCTSTNRYVSGNGYDTVIVCRACHHEEHAPFKEKEDR